MKKYILSLVLCFCVLLSILSVTTYADPTAEDLKTQIRSAVLSHQATLACEAYALTPESMQALIDELFLTSPEFFLVEEVSFSISLEQIPAVTQIHFTYRMNEEESLKAWEFCQGQAAQYVQELSSLGTSAESLLKLQERFIQRTSCSDYLEDSDAYSFFKNQKGDSFGASMAFQLVCDQLGFDAKVITSSLMEHSWNTVRIDGKRYHVDLTADDALSPSEKYISRSHCLLSDQGIKRLGYVDYPEGSCTSTTYDNAFWKSVSSPIHYLGGYFYYLDPSSGAIRRTNMLTSQGEEIVSPEKNWLDSSLSPTDAVYSGLHAWEEQLYYNTATQVIQLDPETLSISVYATPTLEQGEQIYGLWSKDDATLILDIATSPDEQVKHTTIALPERQTFSIIFIADGSIVATYKLAKGDTIPEPSQIPSKSPTETGRYVFNGWNGYLKNMKAYSDSVFYASFSFLPYPTTAPSSAPAQSTTPVVSSVTDPAPSSRPSQTQAPVTLPPTQSIPSIIVPDPTIAPTVPPATHSAPATTGEAEPPLPSASSSVPVSQSVLPSASTTVFPSTSPSPTFGNQAKPGYSHRFPQGNVQESTPVSSTSVDSAFDEEQPKDHTEGQYREYLPWIVAISGSVLVVGFIIFRELVLVPRKKNKNEPSEETRLPEAETPLLEEKIPEETAKNEGPLEEKETTDE